MRGQARKCNSANKPGWVCTSLSNGARGTRTPDLLGAIQALSQLSYSPKVPICRAFRLYQARHRSMTHPDHNRFLRVEDRDATRTPLPLTKALRRPREVSAVATSVSCRSHGALRSRAFETAEQQDLID